MPSDLEIYIKQKETALMANLKELKLKLYNMPMSTNSDKKLLNEMSDKLKLLEAKIKSSKEYKIVTLLKYFKVNLDDDEEHPDVEALNWLENNLTIYMVGFGYDCEKKRNSAFCGQLDSSKEKNIKKRITRTVNYMQKKMTLEQINGFIKVNKLNASGVSLPQCIKTGAYKKEQWDDTSSICSAISSEFPDDVSNCQKLVLKELIKNWPSN